MVCVYINYVWIHTLCSDAYTVRVYMHCVWIRTLNVIHILFGDI